MCHRRDKRIVANQKTGFATLVSELSTISLTRWVKEIDRPRGLKIDTRNMPETDGLCKLGEEGFNVTEIKRIAGYREFLLRRVDGYIRYVDLVFKTHIDDLGRLQTKLVDFGGYDTRSKEINKDMSEALVLTKLSEMQYIIYDTEHVTDGEGEKQVITTTRRLKLVRDRV